MSFARHINQSNGRMRCAAFTKHQQTSGINVCISEGSNQSVIQSNGIHQKKKNEEPQQSHDEKKEKKSNQKAFQRRKI